MGRRNRQAGLRARSSGTGYRWNLRHFTELSGRKPSAAKRASYLEARRRFGMTGCRRSSRRAQLGWSRTAGVARESWTMAQLEMVIDAGYDETLTPEGA